MVKDTIDQGIKVGCYISYWTPDRYDAFRIAKVIELWEDETAPEWRRYRITARSIDRAWDKTITLSKKNSVLERPNRILVMLEEQVPPAYRELLESIE